LINYGEDNLGSQIYGINYSQYHEFTGETHSS